MEEVTFGSNTELIRDMAKALKDGQGTVEQIASVGMGMILERLLIENAGLKTTIKHLEGVIEQIRSAAAREQRDMLAQQKAELEAQLKARETYRHYSSQYDVEIMRRLKNAGR